MFSTRKMALSSAAPDCSLRGFGPPELPSSPSAPCRETVCIYVYYVHNIHIYPYVYVYIYIYICIWCTQYTYIHDETACIWLYMYTTYVYYIIYPKVHTKHQKTYETEFWWSVNTVCCWLNPSRHDSGCPSVDWITKSYLVGGATTYPIYGDSMV